MLRVTGLIQEKNLSLIESVKSNKDRWICCTADKSEHYYT